MSITPLPTPPSRSDSANFAERGDAFMSALPNFSVEAEAARAQVVTKEASAVSSASTATTKASEASASASAALTSKNAAATSATSASTSASTATTKAAEASASAASIAWHIFPDIVASADLNVYLSPGVYRQPSSANAASGANYPAPNSGWLHVFSSSSTASTGVTQIYYAGNTNLAYMRSLISGTWSEWIRFLGISSGGDLILPGRLYKTTSAAVTVSVTSTLTTASILNTKIKSSPSSNITLSLPDGTSMDSAISGAVNGTSIDFSVINISSTSSVTLASATGHTIEGSAVILPGASGRFELRRASVGTFITTRLS